MSAADADSSTDAVSVTDGAASLPAALAASKVESAPLREDQVANAVAFLTNPKVVGSTAGAKRSFLAGKGVTDEEIDEAVRRAASIPPQPSAPQATPNAPPPPSAAVVSAAGPAAEAPASWAQRSASIALVALAAYGVGTLVSPLARKAWYYFWPSSEPADVKQQLVALYEQFTKRQDAKLAEVTTSATAALQQVKEEASRSQGAQQSSNEYKGYLESLRDEVGKLKSAVENTAGVSQELSELRTLMQRQQTTASERSTPEVMSRWQPRPDAGSPSPYLSAKVSFPEPDLSAADRAAAAARTSSPPSAGSPRRPGAGEAAHSASFGSNLAAAAPPAYAVPDTMPASFAWGTRGAIEAADGAASRPGGGVPGANGAGPPPPCRVSAGPSEGSQGSHHSEPAKPADYMGILDMLSRGETPPGIRTDIDDKPSPSTLKPLPPPAPPRSKPWQTSNVTTNGLQSALLQHVGDDGAASGGETWIPSPSRPADDGEASGAPLYEARALLASAAGSSSQNQSPLAKGILRLDADSASVEAFGPGMAARQAAGSGRGSRAAKVDRSSTNGHAGSAAPGEDGIAAVSSEMSSHALQDDMSEVDES